MKEHDALVLPSILEGRALVQQEALSCGLPIIVTPNAGGEDLVEEGETGHLVSIRSPETIANAICTILANNIKKKEIQQFCQKKRVNIPGRVMLKRLLISTCLTQPKNLKLLNP